MSVPVNLMTSLIARWISSGPPAISPTARTEAWTITVSPAVRPRERRSLVSRMRSCMGNAGRPSTEKRIDCLLHRVCRLDPRVVALLVHVALVVLVAVNADARRVVRADSGTLELTVEPADRRVRVRAPPPARARRLVLARRHLRHDGDALIRR